MLQRQDCSGTLMVHQPLTRWDPGLDMLAFLCLSHTTDQRLFSFFLNLILCSLDYFKSLPVPSWTGGKIVRNEFIFLPPHPHPPLLLPNTRSFCSPYKPDESPSQSVLWTLSCSSYKSCHIICFCLSVINLCPFRF